MGQASIPPSDFERMTFEEILAAYDSWKSLEEHRDRSAWMRMRQEALTIIQPFVNKQLHPQKIMPFPWEKRKRHEVSAEEVERTRARLQYYQEHGCLPD